MPFARGGGGGAALRPRLALPAVPARGVSVGVCNVGALHEPIMPAHVEDWLYFHARAGATLFYLAARSPQRKVALELAAKRGKISIYH